MLCVRICKKVLCLALTVLLLCSLTGCMLLPKEEKEREVVFVRNDELQEYELISPIRMDLEQTVDISCSYKQLEEITLNFTQDNYIVESVNISKGDTVKKGTLLAKLDTKGLEDEIREMEESILQEQKVIDQLKVQVANDKKYVELDYKYKNITKEERNQRLAEIEDVANNDIKAKEDEVYIKKLRLEEKKKIDEGSKIYAPIDGYISYVRDDLLGSVSNKELGVIKMIDPKKCAFAIYVTEESKVLKPGETYKVDCEGISCEGVLEPVSKEDSSFMYLRLKKPPQELQVGMNGVIHCLVDNKKDVLVLPSEIVHKGKDYYFVYMEDKNKVKVIRKVEIGMITEEYTEIVSGISEDDHIIKE